MERLGRKRLTKEYRMVAKRYQQILIIKSSMSFINFGKACSERSKLFSAKASPNQGDPSLLDHFGVMESFDLPLGRQIFETTFGAILGIEVEKVNLNKSRPNISQHSKTHILIAHKPIYQKNLDPPNPVLNPPSLLIPPSPPLLNPPNPLLNPPIPLFNPPNPLLNPPSPPLLNPPKPLLNPPIPLLNPPRLVPSPPLLNPLSPPSPPSPLFKRYSWQLALEATARIRTMTIAKMFLNIINN